MNKQDLVAKLSEKLELSSKDAAKVLEATFEVVTEALLAGEDVKVPGFGVFKVKERAAREGVVPNTKEKIEIPAKKVVSFGAAKALKEELNK